MTNKSTIIHLILLFLLILLVLMQNGKGSSAGIFGSSNSDSVFSSPSAATFITKFTAVVALIIMLTSIFLTISASKKGMSSIVDMKNIPVNAVAAREAAKEASEKPFVPDFLPAENAEKPADNATK